MNPKRFSEPFGVQKEMWVDKAALVEGILLLIFGTASLVDGFRLNVMEKVQLYDVLGPGNYNIGLGLILIILGLIYLPSYSKKSLNREKLLQEKRFIKKILSLYFVMLRITLTFKVRANGGIGLQQRRIRSNIANI